MDLQKFVQTTICEIIKGINDAKTSLSNDGIGAAINPVWGISDNLNDNHVLQMDFDVAITVATANQSEGGGESETGIRVLSAGLGKEKFATEQSSASRVKFSVPYIPPSTTVVRPTRHATVQSDYDPLG